MAKKKKSKEKSTKKGPSRTRYSRDFKLAIVRAFKAGITAKLLQEKHGVSIQNVYNWAKRVDEVGEEKAFRRGGVQTYESLTEEQLKVMEAIPDYE